MKEIEFEAILNGEIEGLIYKAERISISGKIEIQQWRLETKLGQTFTISHRKYHNGLVDTYQRALDQFNYGSYFVTKEEAIKSAISRLESQKNIEITKTETLIAELKNMLPKKE